MKQIKCNSCGANISIKSNEKMIICPYCNSTYIIEDEISESSDINLEEIKKQKEEIGKKVNKSSKILMDNGQEYPEYVYFSRPKFNFILFLFCLIYWPVALIYAILISNKQKVWDEYHNKVNNNK